MCGFPGARNTDLETVLDMDQARLGAGGTVIGAGAGAVVVWGVVTFSEVMRGDAIGG
nr:hypothetical protein Ade03nite_56820 [Actinoplanes derwentensis]